MNNLLTLQQIEGVFAKKGDKSKRSKQEGSRAESDADCSTKNIKTPKMDTKGSKKKR